MFGGSITEERKNKALNNLLLDKDLNQDDRNILNDVGTVIRRYVLRNGVKEHWWNEICDRAEPVQDIAIVKEIKGRYFCFYYYDSTSGATYPTSIYEVYRNEEKDINDFNCWYPRVKGVNDGT